MIRRRPSTAMLAALSVLTLYTLYSMGPLFWLVLSSFKSRADLFTVPPTLFFTPDLSGYQGVFGVGEAAGGYGQFWGMRSGSGLVPGSGDGLAVAETDAANDLAEALGAVQSPPVPLG